MTPPGSPVDLVIFDCDGVLVDSEPIALALLRDTIAAAGLALSAETVQREFQGRSLAAVRERLRDAHGLAIAPDVWDAMDDELLARFTRELRPVPGMGALVAALPCRACVASSSNTRRLRHSLAVAGLASLFGSHVFSADAVARGKPAPDLFLHAAARMGVAPERCVVVEDSPAGIEAARAAGMDVVGFAGGSHLAEAAVARLREAGAPVVAGDAAALAAFLPEHPDQQSQRAEGDGDEGHA